MKMGFTESIIMAIGVISVMVIVLFMATGDLPYKTLPRCPHCMKSLDYHGGKYATRCSRCRKDFVKSVTLKELENR